MFPDRRCYQNPSLDENRSIFDAAMNPQANKTNGMDGRIYLYFFLAVFVFLQPYPARHSRKALPGSHLTTRRNCAIYSGTGRGSRVSDLNAISAKLAFAQHHYSQYGR